MHFLYPLLLAALTLAACDNCTTNKALPTQLYESFTSESNNFNASHHVAFSVGGASLGIFRRGNNPMIQSLGYLWHGKVEAEIMGALGTGIISSFYLQSDDLDEIDIVETFGGNVFTCQTNFFVKGNISNYARGEYHMPPLLPLTEFHKYSVEWTPEYMAWAIDDVEVRRTERGNPHGFPQSPMRVIASLWAGGDPENHRGTIDWAGGITNYDLVPYIMRIRNVRIENYSGGADEYELGRNGTVVRRTHPNNPSTAEGGAHNAGEQDSHKEGARSGRKSEQGDSRQSLETTSRQLVPTTSSSYTLRGFFQVRSRSASGQLFIHWAAAFLGALQWWM